MYKFFRIAGVMALAALLVLAAGCSKEPNLTDYVSEYRSNIYVGTQDKYSIFVSCGTREYPYRADGTPADCSDLFEVALTAADNTRTYKISFALDGKTYEAELSFDNVRMIHTYSQSIPAPDAEKIDFTVCDADDADAEKISLTAQSVKAGQQVLSLGQLLDAVKKDNSKIFGAHTSGNKFSGELYVRLLWNDGACYYYVGVIDTDGKTFAILADASTGKTLATHESEDTL